MTFSYQGETLLLDCIDSTGGSQLIFTNTHNGNGCGVAANNSTVGLSFELGCLNDTILPSTRLVLIDSIMEYLEINPTCIGEYGNIQPVTKPSLVVFPNPSFRTFTIQYNLGMSDPDAQLKIYDVTGRLVKVLDVESRQAGLSDCVYWDGRDENSREIGAGVYFVTLVCGEHAIINKAVLIK
jgi:hypothetical protein